MAEWFKSLRKGWGDLQDEADQAKGGIDRLAVGVMTKGGIPEEDAVKKARNIQELAETAAAGVISPLGGEAGWITGPAVADEFGSAIDQLARKRMAIKRAKLGDIASDEAKAGIKDLGEAGVADIKAQIKARGGAHNASEDAILNSLPVEAISPGPVMPEGRNFSKLKELTQQYYDPSRRAFPEGFGGPSSAADAFKSNIAVAKAKRAAKLKK